MQEVNGGAQFMRMLYEIEVRGGVASKFEKGTENSKISP